MKKNHGKTSLVRRLATKPVLVVAGLLLISGSSIPIVRAATLQEQIDSLSADSAQKQSSVDSLQLQASNYQDAINKLQGEINAIQGAINASEAKQAQLQQQIDAAQKRLDYEKKVLGELLKTMYVNGQMSTVEMLATSKDLSTFVDAETYRTAVQGKIQSTLTQITDLQNQLEEQKAQVEQLLATQKTQEARLASDRSQQDALLAMNQAQQASYNKQIAANRTKISALEAEQARINAASSITFNAAPSGGRGGACDIGHGNGNYPMGWCNAGQDSVLTSGDFPNRECTSFAYWYFTIVEGKSLKVYGDAKDWIYTSNRPVSQTPHIGDIFVHTAGEFGHVGIVTDITDGYVHTMSMNDGYDGAFYNTRGYPISELYYIH